jgi:3-phenylpropionate/trans-cinnamate dioxygenase ferredoxin subunit
LTVGPLDELAPGTMCAVSPEGHLPLAVARLDGGDVVVFDDTCTHEECSLSEGDLEGRAVVCYCHNAKFDLETGSVLRGPAEDPIRIYPTRSSEQGLQVRIEEAAA